MSNQRKLCTGLIASIAISSQLGLGIQPALSQTANDAAKEKTEQKQSIAAGEKEILQSVDKLLENKDYKGARAKLEPLLKEARLKKNVPVIIAAYERLALVDRKENRFINAQRSLKFALGLCKPGEDDFDGISTKVRILFYIADIENELGQYRKAHSIAKQGIEAVRELAIQGRLPYMETELLNNDAHALLTQGNLQKAKETLEEAAYMAKSLEDEPDELLIPASPVSRHKEFLEAKILVTGSILNEVQGKIAESKKKAKQASEIFEKHIEEVLDEPRYAKYIFKTHLKDDKLVARVKEMDNLTEAALLEVQADEASSKDAIKLLEESLKIKNRLLEANSATIGNTKVRLAELYLETGDLKKAARLSSEGYKGLAGAMERTSPFLARATAVLGRSYLANGQVRGVEQLLNHAWKLEAKRLGNDSPEVLIIMDALSELYMKTGDYLKAIRLSVPVTLKKEKEFGRSSLKLVQNLTNTGVAYAQIRSCKKATAPLNRAKSILEKNGKTKTKEYADVLAGIGINQTHSYKWKLAKVSLRKSIDIYKSLYGENHPNTQKQIRLYQAMYKKRRTVPGLNKNILKARPMKLRPPTLYGK